MDCRLQLRQQYKMKHNSYLKSDNGVREAEISTSEAII